ncbi:NAD(P)H-dependent flavin oxidoreductase [Klebsiella aerogenes]
MNQHLPRLLNIRYPIIQAPMAGVSTPSLAAAVSNAGGLGSLGLGASTVTQALIEQTRQLTDRPFNVNLFCHTPSRRDAVQEAQWLARLAPAFARYHGTPPKQLNEIYQTFHQHQSMLDMLLEQKPAVVSFHFGVPSSEVIRRFQQQGTVTMASATCVDEARLIAQAGIDVVIAQGYEAGGHRGIFDPHGDDRQMSTFTLLQALKQAVDLPIVAAGGIMHGAAIASLMQLGASGVQLGTAFLLCPEAGIDSGYRQALTQNSDVVTFLTAAISGRPARCVKNSWHEIGEGEIPAYPLAYDAGKALATAAKAQGDHGFGAHWAGQGVAMIREMPAAELVRVLVKEGGLQ